MIDIHVDEQEFHTILAALRYYQEKHQGDPANRSDWIHEIATDGDEVISLDEDAIDELCERLNMGLNPNAAKLEETGSTMKRFEVPIIYRGRATYLVEAVNTDEAQEKARSLFHEGVEADNLGNEWEEIEQIKEAVQIDDAEPSPVVVSAVATDDDDDEATSEISVSVLLRSDLYGTEEFNYSSVPEALDGAQRLIQDVIRTVEEDGIERQVIVAIASSSDDCT